MPSGSTISFVDEIDVKHVKCGFLRKTNRRGTATSSMQEKRQEPIEERILTIVTNECNEMLSNVQIEEHVVRCDKLISQKNEMKRAVLDESCAIIGDNLDFLIPVKHMASDNQNKSFHWFNLLGLINRVTGSNLSNNQPIRDVADLTTTDFIPSQSLHRELMDDFIQIFVRIMVDDMDVFKDFRKSVTRHIPHKYSEEMSRKTTEV